MRSSVPFLFLLLGFTARADECATKDFRGEISTYDQSFSGWCFAHSTAATMSQVLGKKVSAGAVAVDTALAEPADFDRLSDPDSQAYVKEHPDVKEDLDKAHSADADHYIEKNAFSYTTVGDDITHHGIMDLGGSEEMALLLAKERGICEDAKFPSGDKNYQRGLDELTALLKRERAEQKKHCAPNGTNANKGPVQTLSGHASPILRRTLEKWLEQKCGKREVVSKPLIPRTLAIGSDLGDYRKKYPERSAERHKARDSVFGEINANFDRGRISAIGYDYCEHSKEFPELGQCTSKKVRGVVGSPSEDHSGILTARKMIGGSCHYFLQIHTKGCGDFNDTYAKSSYTEDGKPRPGCESQYGGIWISRDQLKSVYSVFSIK